MNNDYSGDSAATQTRDFARKVGLVLLFSISSLRYEMTKVVDYVTESEYFRVLCVFCHFLHFAAHAEKSRSFYWSGSIVQYFSTALRNNKGGIQIWCVSIAY